METPQPPQVSVSGSIVIQGQLTPPSSPIAESEPPVPPPAPWWQFWRWRAERVLVGATVVLAMATIVLAFATVALVGTAIIQHGDALDAIKATNRFAKAAEDYTNYSKSLALSSTQLIEANIASERATFQISKFELVEKQPNDPTPTVNFSFINLGRTAAVLNEFNIDCELIGENISNEPNYDPKKTKRGGGAVPPNGLVDANTISSGGNCSLQRPLANDDYEALEKGHKIL